MVEHTLKCLSNYFDAVMSGEKMFEVRRDDRGFQKGDTLLLRKFTGTTFVPAPGSKYGWQVHELRCRITYVLKAVNLGSKPAMSFWGLSRLRLPMSDRTDLFTEKGKVAVSVQFCTVTVELDCGDEYAAQVLFDEITERLQRGEGLTLKARQETPSNG